MKFARCWARGDFHMEKTNEKAAAAEKTGCRCNPYTCKNCNC